MELPNTLFLGPDKAGSTWLYWQFNAHPDCFVPKSKEIFFFDRYYHRGLEWYARFFREANGAKIRVDISHDYLYSEDAPLRVSACESIRYLIVIVREPIDRALSSYRFMKSQGRLSDISFLEALERVPLLLDRGRYAYYLSRWMEACPSRRFLVYIFDDLVEDADKFWRAMCRDLDIAETTAVELSKQRRNVARVARWPGIVHVGRKVGWILRDCGLHSVVWRLKTNRIVGSLLWDYNVPKSEREVEELEEARARYRHRFLSDIAWLSKYLGCNLYARWGYEVIGEKLEV